MHFFVNYNAVSFLSGVRAPSFLRICETFPACNQYSDRREAGYIQKSLWDRVPRKQGHEGWGMVKIEAMDCVQQDGLLRRSRRAQLKVRF